MFYKITPCQKGHISVKKKPVTKKKEKTREAKPGELRGIKYLETLQRLFARPESRIDAQKQITSFTPNTQAYVKHLVMSGPLEDAEAAKECGFTLEQLEEAIKELEKGLTFLTKGK